MPERVALQTKRLVLRPFELADIDDALAYRDDREFAHFLPHIPQPFTRRDAEAWVRQNMIEPWVQFATFAVVFEGRVVGTVNLELDAAETTAMLGYALARRCWGLGLATEASRAVIEWGFRTREVQRIWASTDTLNLRSIRVLEKLGLQRERVAKSEKPARDGTLHDEVFFGLSREAWARQQA